MFAKPPLFNPAGKDASQMLAAPRNKSISRRMDGLLRGAGPKSRLVVSLGDSRQGKGRGTGQTKYGNGVQYHAEMVTRGKLRFPTAFHLAVAGTTTGDMVTQSAASVAFDADFALIWSGINDITNRQTGAGGTGSTPATLAGTIANIDAVVQEQLSLGRRAIIVAETPLGGSVSGGFGTLTSAYLEELMRLAQVLRSYSRVPGCHVIDLWQIYADMGVADGRFIDGVSYDNQHLSALGALLVSRKIKAIADLYLEDCDMLPSSPADKYSATNPTGALNPNAFMLGTAGIKGTGATGTVADNWTVASNDSAYQVLAEKVAAGIIDARIWQKLTISGTPTAALPLITMSQNIASLANLAVGDTIEGLCEMRVDAGAANVYTPYLDIRAQGTGLDLSQSGLHGNSGHQDGYAPAIGFGGPIYCDPITVSAGFTSCSVRLGIYGKQGQAASAVVYVTSTAVRKVA